MSQSNEYTVAQFITDTKGILRQEGPTLEGLKLIGENMRILVKRSDLYDQGIDIGAGHGAKGRRLHLEPDNSLVLEMGAFRRDQPTVETTRMHSHGTWGVFYAYSGREHYGLWERIDDGGREGHAELRQLKYGVLEPGDITVMTDPPGDIHTHSPIDEEFWIVGLFGNHAAREKRLYFTPQWLVREGEYEL